MRPSKYQKKPPPLADDSSVKTLLEILDQHHGAICERLTTALELYAKMRDDGSKATVDAKALLAEIQTILGAVSAAKWEELQTYVGELAGLIRRPGLDLCSWMEATVGLRSAMSYYKRPRQEQPAGV